MDYFPRGSREETKVPAPINRNKKSKHVESDSIGKDMNLFSKVCILFVVSE